MHTRGFFSHITQNATHVRAQNPRTHARTPTCTKAERRHIAEGFALLLFLISL